MNKQPLTYHELNALAAELMELGGNLRNGTVAARDAWHIVESVADQIRDHAINTMLTEVGSTGE